MTTVRAVPTVNQSPPLRGDFNTLGDAMDAAREQFRDREAYVEGDRRVTFGEWLDACDRAAARFADRGVQAGDVVALMLPTSIDYAIAFGAAVRLGAIATGLNPRLGPREVAAIFERAQPKLAVREARDLTATAGRETVPPIRHDGHPSEPVVIIWTSGTTGLPKGAWFDHDNLRAAVTTAGVMTAPFDRRLVTTPFAHAGYMAKLWEQLAWATTLVIAPTPWTADDTVRLLGTERITVAGGAPAQWAKIVEHPLLSRTDASHLRLCVAATAPAPPELVERVMDAFGCPMVVRYAMTESPSITGTEPGDDPEVLFRTVGRPQAGVEIELRDEASARVTRGDVGRVHVRSAYVMRGYWREPALTGEAIDAQRWLRTSDLGWLDPAGNLVLVGRADDMYIRGGYNVFPLEVENVLAEHPAVEEASVVGFPAPIIGEIGVAFVVPAAETLTASTVELRAWCRARLADYKAPDRIVVVESLPLTPMMKVDKRALRTRLEENEGNDAPRDQ
jgi:acyl-CoA synthetase (AMP-forming)/AMP-acid ligase II